MTTLHFKHDGKVWRGERLEALDGRFIRLGRVRQPGKPGRPRKATVITVDMLCAAPPASPPKALAMTLAQERVFCYLSQCTDPVHYDLIQTQVWGPRGGLSNALRALARRGMARQEAGKWRAIPTNL